MTDPSVGSQATNPAAGVPPPLWHAMLCHGGAAPSQWHVGQQVQGASSTCLCMGYSGGQSGAYEALGTDRCQPSYICFDAERCMTP